MGRMSVGRRDAYRFCLIDEIGTIRLVLSGELFCDVPLNSPHYIKKRRRMG